MCTCQVHRKYIGIQNNSILFGLSQQFLRMVEDLAFIQDVQFT